MSKTDFKTYLQKASDEIEKELNSFSMTWNNDIKRHFPELGKLNNQFTDSFFGGKMLRGTLVKLGYELVKTKPTQAIFKPAAAYEMLHTSLLIHDDIIDQSPLRRGKPALHIQSKNKHYGVSQAICLGDLGIALASQLLATSNFSAEKKQLALNYFLQTVSDTILGEMLDVESSLLFKRTEKQINTIQKMKTAHYTFVGPLQVGAILSGASDSELKKIKQFGEQLGIAYQIQDDILGIFGDEKTIGKSTTSDNEENKSTLLITYSLQNANTKQRGILKNYYGKKGITKKEQEMIKQIFQETGALAYSQNKITQLTSLASALIPQLSQNKAKQTLLKEMIELLVQRNK